MPAAAASIARCFGPAHLASSSAELVTPAACSFWPWAFPIPSISSIL
jgi:hypothetical protein